MLEESDFFLEFCPLFASAFRLVESLKFPEPALSRESKLCDLSNLPCTWRRLELVRSFGRDMGDLMVGGGVVGQVG